MYRQHQQGFQERAAKSGNENAGPIWHEAMDQVGKGRLRPPLPPTKGRSNGLIRKEWGVAFRFGVDRNGKIRAFGDSGPPNTPRACAVLTPINLVSFGQIAEMCRSIRDKSRAWVSLRRIRIARHPINSRSTLTMQNTPPRRRDHQRMGGSMVSSVTP